jgi:hypothetical protein
MNVIEHDLTKESIISFDILGTIDRLFCSNIDNIKNIGILTDNLYYALYDNTTLCRDQKIIFSFFYDLYLKRVEKAHLRLQIALVDKLKPTKLYVAYRKSKMYPFTTVSGTFDAISKYDTLNDKQKKMITKVMTHTPILLISDDNVVESKYDNGIYYYDVTVGFAVYTDEPYDIVRKVKFILSDGTITIM